jgi:BRCT domain type II-containing protein
MGQDESPSLTYVYLREYVKIRGSQVRAPKQPANSYQQQKTSSSGRSDGNKPTTHTSATSSSSIFVSSANGTIVWIINN